MVQNQIITFIVCAMNQCTGRRSLRNRNRRRRKGKRDSEEKEREEKEEDEKDDPSHNYENYINGREEEGSPENDDDEEEDDTEEYESDYSSPSTPSSPDSDDSSGESSTDTDFEADPTLFYTLDRRSETFASYSLALHARNVGFSRGADTRIGLVCPSTRDPLLLRCRDRGSFSNESIDILNSSWLKFKECNWKPHISKTFMTELAILDGDRHSLRLINQVVLSFIGVLTQKLYKTNSKAARNEGGKAIYCSILGQFFRKIPTSLGTEDYFFTIFLFPRGRRITFSPNFYSPGDGGLLFLQILISLGTGDSSSKALAMWKDTSDSFFYEASGREREYRANYSSYPKNLSIFPFHKCYLLCFYPTWKTISQKCR